MRILLVLAAFPLLTTFAPLELFSEPVPPERTTLRMTPVPLDERDPVRRQVGRLVYLGGWHIQSNDPRFGGVSAMHVDGGEVTALSDAGSVIRFRVGGAEASIAPIAAGPGRSAEKGDRDAEAMAVAGRRLWIAFEGANQVWRYGRRSWRRLASAAPPAMKRWSINSGSEAMLRLEDGRFLVFAEGAGRSGGTSAALLFDGDPAEEGTKATALRYRPPEGYRITDAALLPGGGMLFLNRRFAIPAGFTAKLTLMPPQALRRDSVLAGAEIAHLEAPVAADNMEALSVTREEGRTIVWIASDDNLNPIQRTLLLKFALAE
jgi:hypothetical protein